MKISGFQLIRTLFCLFSITFSFCGFSAEPADTVFQLSATSLPEQGGIQLHWNIADNAYLYQKSIHVLALDSTKVHVGKPIFPAGDLKKTKIYGNVVIYHHTLDINVPIEIINNITNNSFNSSAQQSIMAKNIELKISYQGCSDKGQCYPPITQTLKIDFNTSFSDLKTPDRNSASLNVSANNSIENPSHAGTKNLSSQTTTINTVHNALNIQQKLADYSIIQMALLFLALGVFLSLTPCVLPMIPILSSIILQEHHHTHHPRQSIKPKKYKAFFLSFSYVLGIAIAYALLGFLMSSLGNHVQTFFQKPIILILFGCIFVVLALSLFGLFEVKLLHKTHHKLAHITHKLAKIAGKNYLTTLIMGALSALVVSPCVTPPLVGVLAYIATTGNVFMGTTLLFFMGFGMGIPLIIIGVLENKFLPKTGAWMEMVKFILGLMLLGMAVALWQRVIPVNKIPLLWSSFIILVSILLFYRIRLKTKFMRILFQTACFLAMVYGALSMIENITGITLFNNHKTQKNSFFSQDKSPSQHKLYVQAKTTKQLNNYLTQAKAAHKPVIVDFYADWCLDCITMERTVFNQNNIKQELQRFVWIKVDMSKDTPAIWELEEQYNIAGPPTFLFYSTDGKQVKSLDFVGFKSQKEVLEILRSIQ